LLSEAAGIANQKKRASLYQQAQQHIMRDAVILPIQQKRTVMAFNARISGLRFTSVTYPLLYAARWRA
jgi:ABC-type transport system substrate-binding protein